MVKSFFLTMYFLISSCNESLRKLQQSKLGFEFWQWLNYENKEDWRDSKKTKDKKEQIPSFKWVLYLMQFYEKWVNVALNVEQGNDLRTWKNVEMIKP